MKKTLLSILALSFVGVSNAQIGFSASTLAEFGTMTSVDADGDTFNWGVYDLMTANAGAPVGTPFDSQGDVLGSFSYDNAGSVALTPDNWVISPAINLTGLSAASVSWGRASVDPAFPSENYSVYVVTAADQAALIAALPTATPVFTETIATGGVWGTKTVAINSFAGQNNVYVAFRHHNCTDQFFLVLDDIVVDQPASINEMNLEVSMFPNPANDVLNISTAQDISSIKVVSLDGKVVLSESVQGSTCNVNVSGLTSGAYVLEVVGNNGSVNHSNFIKK
jgi:hypothetical protein